MSDAARDDLIRAVTAAAAAFDGRGSVIKERELELAIESSLWALGWTPARQRRVRLERAWSGRVGGVDLTLEGEAGPIFVELKWDATTLAACAWDQLKLAAALQAEEASRAFLIAGSPSLGGLRGDELLDAAEVEPVALRGQYAPEFDRWKADVKNHPVTAPARWRIMPAHTAPLRYKEEAWRIRLAEVELVDPRPIDLRVGASATPS